jgi:hypothetical protein
MKHDGPTNHHFGIATHSNIFALLKEKQYFC